MTLKPIVRGRFIKAALVLAFGTSTAVLIGVGGAKAQSAEGSPDANGFTPDATIIEIMESMVMPSAQVLWDAVAVDVTINGTIETKPETDEDWEKLRWSAVTLAEATNNLVIPGRAVDAPGAVSEFPEAELGPEQIQELLDKNWLAWVGYAHVLHATALQAIDIIDKKDVDGLSEIGGTIDAACESCHLQFWYPEDQQ